MSIPSELRKVMEEATHKILDEVTVVLVKAEKQIPWETVYGVLCVRKGAVKKLVEMLPETITSEQTQKKVILSTQSQETLPLSEHQKEFWQHSLARMLIEDVFTISGRGTVVTGCVASGTFRVGEKVSLESSKGTLDTVITGIEMFRKLLDEAHCGDNIGILLRGIRRDEVDQGDIIVKLV